MHTPQALIDKYGADFLEGLAPDILAGLIIQEQRRSELGVRSETPQPVAMSLPGIDPKDYEYPKRVKIWAALGLAAIRAAKTGAWRVWALAKVVDRHGSGRIAQDKLRGYLSHLGVNRRTQRRWIAQAKELALIVEHTYKVSGDRVYILAGTAKAAIILQCPEIGKPATIESSQVVSKGWRAYVWAAYLVTLKGPMSQKRKESVTGISERTQRNYQRTAPGRAIKNFARIKGPKDKVYLAGAKDVLGKALFIDNHGQVVQRLPDFRVVFGAAAKRHGHVGRSQKIQRVLNAASLDVQREQCQGIRIFHTSDMEAKQAQRSHKNYPASLHPDEIFIRAHKGKNAYRWDAIELTGGASTYAIL